MFESLKNTFEPLHRRIREYYELWNFRRLLSANRGKCLNVVVGSSGIYEKDWLPSEGHFLNLLSEQNWLKYFQTDSVDRILGEHVWEHLTLEDGLIAATTCYKFLKKGGRLRVAVPDGFHPDENYIELVKPGGRGSGADDHKVLYNYQTFSRIFELAGFQVELLEYFDENRVFKAQKWNISDGYVRRSIRYDKRNSDGKPVYTSLIIDAIK